MIVCRAIVAAATIEESALETSGTWRDAAAAPTRTRPSTGDAEIDVRVIGADFLEVGVAAGMENLLENENRSIDDPYYSSTTNRDTGVVRFSMVFTVLCAVFHRFSHLFSYY